jgi:hypothetical protein
MRLAPQIRMPEQPGHYSVTAEHTGFKTSIQNDITLEVDQTVRADLHLDVGSATQKVEVAANALTLDTDTPAVAQAINEKQVSELPVNGRSFVNLHFLEPGAVQTGGEQSTYRYAASDAISIGGTAVDARSYFNRFPQPVAPLKQNQFGYSLGGPVILPKIYNGRNRTFFCQL